MSAQPPLQQKGDPAMVDATPVAWYKSQRFIALCQSTVLFALGWLISALSTNDWTNWKAGVIAILGNVLIGLKDWWNPNIVAPFAALNKNNTGVPKP